MDLSLLFDLPFIKPERQTQGGRKKKGLFLLAIGKEGEGGLYQGHEAYFRSGQVLGRPLESSSLAGQEGTLDA